MNSDLNNLNQNKNTNGIQDNQLLNNNTDSQLQDNVNLYQQSNNEMNTQKNNYYQSIQNNNIQSNNEIPNNQLSNNQKSNIDMDANQHQVMKENNQNNINFQYQVQQSIENKNITKNKKVAFIFIIILIITCVIIGSLLIKTFVKSSSNNFEKNNNDNITTIKNTKYTKYNADYPVENRDINYYWNINVDYFDKTKFDGKILFFDNVINTKITGKTLFDNGYSFIEAPTYYGTYDVFRIDNNEIEKDYILKNGQWQAAGKAYPIDADYTGYPFIVNFDRNENMYSDNVEIQWLYDKTNKYIDFVTETVESNIIYPYLDGIKYDNLTIDIIIEKLGVPTYVGSILEKCLYSKGRTDDKKSKMIFAYYYVYDNDVFEFNFMHISGEIKLVGIGYMGRRIFEHSRIDYLRNGGEHPDTSSLKTLLDTEYKEYLKNISKK